MPVDFAERLLFSRYGGVGLGHLDEERDGDGGAKGRAATAAEAAEAALNSELRQQQAETEALRDGLRGARQRQMDLEAELEEIRNA